MANTSLTEILSPATLAQIDNYLLMARVVVEGFMAGMHRSVYHGAGSEFLQYRTYSPGDDLKYVDWKVLARQDRFYTKVYQEETNLNCAIIVDGSASMNYHGAHAPCSKFHYATMVAACLAYLATTQGDNVGLFCYSDTVQCAVPPRRRTGHLEYILTELARIQPAGQADHAQFLPTIAESLRRRGVVVLVSDFLGAENDVPSQLKRFRYTGHDCLAIQILDPDERDLPFSATCRFIDSESGDQVVTSPPQVKTEYQRAMEQFLDTMRQGCLDAQVDYLLHNTTDNLGEMLAAYLNHRRSVY